MLDNTLFVNSFWHWFVMIPPLLGIFGMFLLIRWMSGDRPKPNEQVKTMGHVWDETLEEFNNPLPMWWLWMFYLTMIFAIIYLVLYPGLGSFAGVLKWNEVKQWQEEMTAADAKYGPLFEKFKTQPIAKLAQTPEAMNTGHRLYMAYCIVCHGSDARGVEGKGFPNLRDTDWLWGGKPEEIETTIKQGRNPPGAPAVMSAWKDSPLVGGEEGVKNVAQYVISLNEKRKGEVDAARAEKGKAIFSTICLACHNPDGKGNPALGAPNLTDDVWLYGGTAEAIETSVANGRKGTMPAHGEFLGDAKVHLLAAYVYGLSQNLKPPSP